MASQRDGLVPAAPQPFESGVILPVPVSGTPELTCRPVRVLNHLFRRRVFQQTLINRYIGTVPTRRHSKLEMLSSCVAAVQVDGIVHTSLAAFHPLDCKGLNVDLGLLFLLP